MFVDALALDLLEHLDRVPGEMYALDATRDGVEQMAELLQGRTGVDAVHIISHGDVGRLDLGFAKRELAALMNVPPGVDFEVAEADEVALPASPKEVAQLEDMVILQRPELREEDLRRRITADEARKQMLALLPGISFSYGRQHDSNRFLHNDSWSEGGLSLAWNLMRLVSIPAMKNAQAYQEQTDQARRMALSMAILTQTRISAERYRMALEDFKLADQAAQVDTRLAAFTRASVTARLDSELEAIRTQARAVLGAYQRANAYANAHIAIGRLYNTLGFDPIADDFETNDLTKLTERVRAHLRATQENAFAMSSNLFGSAAHSMSVAVTGDEEPEQRSHLTALTSEFLQRQQAGAMEKAAWTLSLSNAQGDVLRSARFDTTVPLAARAGIHEKTLLAALTSHLGELREWLHAE